METSSQKEINVQWNYIPAINLHKHMQIQKHTVPLQHTDCNLSLPFASKHDIFQIELVCMGWIVSGVPDKGGDASP